MLMDGDMMKIGVFGATGMVGREILKVIFERNLAHEVLRLFASEKSAGKIMQTPFGELNIEDADEADFSDIDLAFFAIGGTWSKNNAKRAIEAGCYVIDNSSTFRYDDEVPLIIPEINPEAIRDSKIIANPNCTTAIAAIPLWIIYKRWGINKILISTYQATSGAGAGGMKRLMDETNDYLTHEYNLKAIEYQDKITVKEMNAKQETVKRGTAVKETKKEMTTNQTEQSQSSLDRIFQHPIAFNVIPHIDKFMDNDYTKEEMKVVWETRKIFGDDSIPISCTCVRIPTIRAHSETIVVDTKEPVNPSEFRELLSHTKGVVVKDKPKNNEYPMPLTASKKYDVEVGRIRRNLVFGDTGLEFFVCGDQILKGAALNAVQIAELLVDKKGQKNNKIN
jgi:aspartate-semialdehyde dehydrogenase